MTPPEPDRVRPVRVGVDVGGTFTKAVALDARTGEMVAKSVLPTTHSAQEGVARGVVDAVTNVAKAVGPENVVLVTHSSTQAVNALLEGDVGTVGVIGLGRRPELKRARVRTQLRKVELSPGRNLSVNPAFFDVTDGLDEQAVTDTLRGWTDAGVTAVSVAEAFSPDDPSNEERVVALAQAAGLPACASTELSGLYGLELRAVTAALNASIVPIAMRTAGYVAQGVSDAGITATVMVMRGDGGATDLDGFRRAPARTLYSGPAASVAGALRHTGVREGVVVEIGGTSTNVAGVRYGRPALSYVQVASHATALRAVDVRVLGVAGGSMLRVRRKRVYGVGPRSAHIAGLTYACFAEPNTFLDGATAELISPRIGDPLEYLAVRAKSGEIFALTNTCAANALAIPEPNDYCYAPAEAARAAFAAAGRFLGLDGDEIARRMLQASGEAVAELVLTVTEAIGLKTSPVLIAVGGGAGGLARHVAQLLGLQVILPEGAEVISSIGDALSLIRAERERTVDHIDADVVKALMAEVEEEAVDAGASPGSLDIQVEEQADKGTVRAVATGSVGLAAGAVPGRQPATALEIRADRGLDPEAVGTYWVVRPAKDELVVLDRFGDPVAEITGSTTSDVTQLAQLVERHTRYRGPITMRPSVWVIDGAQLIELSSGDVVASAQALRDTDRKQLFVVGRAA